MRRTLVIDGKPGGQGRPRFGSGRAYKARKDATAEAIIAVSAMDAGWTPAQGPVALTVEAHFEVPRSWPKARRECAAKGEPVCARPDLDNIVKRVLDALNGIAFNDDCQVAAITAVKRYAPAEDGARTVIHVDEMDW